MSKAYPHLTGSTAFPSTDNVDVFKYRNVFDYSRWGEGATVTVLNVPWPSDLSQAVDFGTEEDRDAWFSSQASESVQLTTPFYLVPRTSLKVPMPYGVAVQYNYMLVDVPIMTSQDEMLEYESVTKTVRYCYFIRDIEQKAPNATECDIELDSWTTFLYRVQILGGMLERGHAAMANAADVETFLSNPLAHTDWLLDPDVDYGTLCRVSYAAGTDVDGGTPYVCLVTSADVGGAWGSPSGSWKVPTSVATVEGFPGAQLVVAVLQTDFASFWADVDLQVPQFKRSVLGAFVMTSKLISATTLNVVSFAGHSVWVVSAKGLSTFLSVSLSKSSFGYDTKYADLTKLYTAPYAVIKLTTEEGEWSEVRPQDLAMSSLNVDVGASIVYPDVTVTAQVSGVGGSTSTVYDLPTTDGSKWGPSGRWQNYLHKWDVPQLALFQDPTVENYFSEYYDRAQAQTAYGNTYTTATESALTAQANAHATADNTKSVGDANASTAQADSYANANLTIENTTTQNTANTYVTSLGNQRNTTISNNNVLINNYSTDASNAATLGMQAASATAATETAAVNAVGSVAGGALSGAMSGGPAGAIAGAVGGAVGAASSMVTTAIGVNLSATNASITTSNASQQNTYTNISNAANNVAANSANTDINSAQVTASATIATATAQTAKANADRDYTNATTNNTSVQVTAKANADRDYTQAVANAGRARDTAIAAISNRQAQQALRGPIPVCQGSGTGTMGLRPKLVEVQVTTEEPDSIARAGDQMLRFGYMCRRWVEVNDLQLMKHFTYWKFKDVRLYATDKGVNSRYQDDIRDMLLDGVTVWSTPEEIETEGIYDNLRGTA